MTDWWGVVNSNLVGLIISAFLGVFLASFIQWYLNRQNRRAQTLSLANLFGGEIYSIQRLTANFMRMTAESLRQFKAALDKGDVAVITIADFDPPRTIYDRPSIDLGLFSGDLPSIISELYRRVAYAKYFRERANQFSSDLGIMMKNLELIGDKKERGAELMRIRYAENNFLEAGNSYFLNLKDANKFCDMALDRLKKVHGFATPITAETIESATQVETSNRTN